MPNKLLLAIALSLGVLTDAQAGVIEVAPILVQLNGTESATTILLTNRGDEATTVQVRAFEWSQPNGEDELKPTQEVVASPPIFDLPVGASQTVRILRRKPAEGVERSYRLVVDELPPPSTANKIRFALRVSVPMFVVNDSTLATPKINFTVRQNDGMTEIVGSNTGTQHTRLLKAVLTTSDGTPLDMIAPPTPYILAGAQRVWKIKSTTQARQIHFTAESDFGPIAEDIRF